MHFGYLAMSSKLRLNYFELSCWKLSELGEKEEINKEANDGWPNQFFLLTSSNTQPGKEDLSSLLSLGRKGFGPGGAPKPKGCYWASPTDLFPYRSDLTSN